MIIEKCMGHISEDKYENHHIDYMDIEWYNTHKRIDRKKTRNGLEVGIRLNHDASHRGFRQGDIVYVDEANAIAVNIPPCTCIAVQTEETNRLIKLCYEIGNRHAPFFYSSDHQNFLIPYDKPMYTMIQKIGVHIKIVQEKLLPENKISSAHSHHGHSH